MKKEDEEDIERGIDEDDSIEFGIYDFTDIKKIMKNEGKYVVETKGHRHYLVNGFKLHRFKYLFYKRENNNIYYLYKLDYNDVINIYEVK